jgi:ferritin-like metal-binding protein YciE
MLVLYLITTSFITVGLGADGPMGVQEAEGRPVTDTLVAGAKAKVEHFEIPCYRGLVA